jgi:hypothetical protein
MLLLETLSEDLVAGKAVGLKSSKHGLQLLGVIIAVFISANHYEDSLVP